MGNTNNQKSAEKAKNRRYSRASGFSHWMDNIRDKKSLKISMKQIGEGNGTFTLTYIDESSDDFLSTKSHFTFTGNYQHMSEEERDLFGVGLVLGSQGALILDYSDDPQQAKSDERTESKVTRASKGRADESNIDQSSTGIPTLKMTRFFTEKLACKLTEGNCTQSWTIVQSTLPDCLETTAADILCRVSWLWSGVDGVKATRKAPPGTLDFIGEESFESDGSSSIDLKIRVPHLAAGFSPPVVVLNEVGGWKLGKRTLGL
jgi:hypothetical protein